MRMCSPLSCLPAVAMTALLLSGCGSTPAQIENDVPSARAFEELSSWSRVIETSIEGNTAKREIRGFVEHRRLKDHKEGHYFVYSIKNLKKPVGFYLPSGETYRYKVADNGNVVSQNIGIHRPAASVRHLLEIEEDIEFDQHLRK